MALGLDSYIRASRVGGRQGEGYISPSATERAKRSIAITTIPSVSPERSFFGVADKVAVLLHSHGRGRGSGLEMARDAAMVWTVREDRAVSVRFYIDQAEALEAAGLRE